MRSSVTSCMTMVWLIAAALLPGAVIYTASAQGARVSRSAGDYEVYGIEPQISDMARMVEAYERLSDQYLSLVQHQLNNMDRADRQILAELQKLEKKIDDLSAKVDKLTPAPPAPTPAPVPQPAAPPAPPL
jgi:peptidoglycan hydrolase CwlO-like protein